MLKSQTKMKNPTGQRTEDYSLHSYATNHPTFYHDNQTQQSFSPSQLQSHRETLGQPRMQTLIESEQTIGKSLMEILEQPPMQNLIQSNKEIPGQLRMDTHGQPRMQTLRGSEQTIGKSHMEALEQPHMQTLRSSEDPEKRLEIAREVMQGLRPNKGRPCGHGVGVTKSQVTKFSYELRRMRRQSVSSENRFLLNKVVAQSKEMEKQSRQMKMMEENMNKFIGQLKTALPAFFATGTSNAQLFSGSREDCI